MLLIVEKDFMGILADFSQITTDNNPSGADRRYISELLEWSFLENIITDSYMVQTPGFRIRPVYSGGSTPLKDTYSLFSHIVMSYF